MVNRTADESATILSHEPAVPSAVTPAEEGDTASVSLLDLMRAFLWVGSTSFGAGRQLYLLDTFVRRLRAVTPAEFAEGLTISQTLPGANVPNLAVYLGQMLHGWRGALMGGVVFTLPGLTATMLLGIWLKSGAFPPLVGAALVGVAAVSVTLLIAVVGRLGPATFRGVRGGRWIAAGAFLMAGPLHLGVVTALVTMGALSIWLNRPGAR